MDFELLDVAPLVQQKKKYSNFTVKEIGGPAEILKWRQMQAAKEYAYRMKLEARDERLTSFEKESGQKLDSPGIKKASWSEKVAFADSERKRLAQLEDIASKHLSYTPEQDTKKSFVQRVFGFFKRIWLAANF